MDTRFTFRLLTEADIPMLHEWMHRPHVREWWEAEPSLEALRDKYLPRIAGASDATPYLACLDGTPAGYIQSYVAVERNGWWVGQHDRGVLGIDQFLANAGDLNRGLGTTMIRQFVALLFEDPSITRVQADPRPDNPRAIRSYEKAGFRKAGDIVTPDGPAVLMIIDRPAGG